MAPADADLIRGYPEDLHLNRPQAGQSVIHRAWCKMRMQGPLAKVVRKFRTATGKH